MTVKTDIQLARETLEDYFSTASVKIVTADVVKNICALIERLKHHISEIVETGTGGNYLTDLTNCYKLLLAEVWPSVQWHAWHADDPEIVAYRDILCLYMIDSACMEYLEY